MKKLYKNIKNIKVQGRGQDVEDTLAVHVVPHVEHVPILREHIR
jgi:hypothetical protein